MESIQQISRDVHMYRLSDEEIKELTGETTAAGLSSDGVLPTIWSEEIIRKATKEMVCDRFIGKTESLQGGEEYNLRQKTGMNSGVDMTYTFPEIGPVNIYTVDFGYIPVTPVQSGIGVALTAKAVALADFNLQDQVTQELGYQLRLKRDSNIYNAMVPAGLSIPAGTNEVFAGTDTSIDAGDTFELDLISYAVELLLNDDFKPNAMLATPFQTGYFIRTPQFTEAHRFGNRTIIDTGVLNKYVNLNIEYTNNYTGRTAADTDFTTDGHDVLISQVEKYLMGVTWQPLNMAMHVHPQDQLIYVVGTWIEGFGVMEDAAACLIHCANL
jgi:hypothetical protein